MPKPLAGGEERGGPPPALTLGGEKRSEGERG